MALFPDTLSPGAPTISKRRASQKRTTTRRAQRAAKVAQPTLLLAVSGAEEKFLAHHRAHPEIYRAFKALALEWYGLGEEHWGAAAIFEVLRYKSKVSGKPDDDFKVNNDHRSRYARLFLAEYHDHPVLSRFFEIRALRSA